MLRPTPFGHVLRREGSAVDEDLFLSTYGYLDALNPSFTFTGAELRHGRVVAKKGWFHGGCPILSEE